MRDRSKFHPSLYMQSYLLGVQTLAIGKRSRNGVTTLTQKSIGEVLQDVREHAPEFDLAVSMGRVRAILSKLLDHFQGQSVTDQDRFKLRVTAKGEVLVTSLPSSSNLAV